MSCTELPGYSTPSAHHEYTECPGEVTRCGDVASSHLHASYLHHRTRHQLQEHERRGDCVAGVYCRPDLYEDDRGQCHPLPQCPCTDSGLVYQPGDVIHRSCADW